MNYNSADEEELPEPPLTTVLVVGRSSSGKTNLVKSLLKEYERFDKITYVLNDRTRDWQFTPIYWPQIGEVANCQLVVEVREKPVAYFLGPSINILALFPSQDVIAANTKQYK